MQTVMSSIDAQAVSKNSLAALMAPIAEAAAENLTGLSEPDFDFVPPNCEMELAPSTVS